MLESYTLGNSMPEILQQSQPEPSRTCHYVIIPHALSY